MTSVSATNTSATPVDFSISGQSGVIELRDETNSTPEVCYSGFTSEALRTVMQRYGDQNEIMSQQTKSNQSQNEIASLFSARSSAVIEGNVEEIAHIDRVLEEYGVYELSSEDMAILFPDSKLDLLSYGPPTKPGDTGFVHFWVKSGFTSKGTPYTNLYAQSCYAPENGQFIQEGHALYNCKKLNIYPTKNNYTTEFLKRALRVTADAVAAAEGVGFLQGLLLSKFWDISIDNIFTPGQSFGASAFAVTTQTMVFSYLADVPNYYTHYVTAEQCNEKLIYYVTYNESGILQTALGTTDTVSFNSAYFLIPQNKAQVNIDNRNYARDEFYCSKVELTYPTMENVSVTVNISRRYYGDITSIAGS